MSVERYERQANPEFQNEELMESDLFGDVPIVDPADEQAAEAYAAELRGQLPQITKGEMPEQERTKLLQKGFRMVEDLWGNEQGITPVKSLLNDIRSGIRQRLEITPEHEEDLQVYSSVKHPLQALGITGFVRANMRGKKPVYVTLGYKGDTLTGLDVADVVVGDIPDAESQPKEYDKERDRIIQAVIGQYRRKSAETVRANNPRKGGYPGGKF